MKPWFNDNKKNLIVIKVIKNCKVVNVLRKSKTMNNLYSKINFVDDIKYLCNYSSLTYLDAISKQLCGMQS